MATIYKIIRSKKPINFQGFTKRERKKKRRVSKTCQYSNFHYKIQKDRSIEYIKNSLKNPNLERGQMLL